MRDSVLITGGAGFVGGHLADALLERGCRVRILDVLHPQVHPAREAPSYLHPECELIVGDVCDPDVVDQSLRGIDVVVHLAAAVGVAQSMYEIGRYVNTNSMGTAVLLERILAAKDPVAKVIVASSMSVYGEGAYFCRSCGEPQDVVSRPTTLLSRRQWEPICQACDSPLEPLPTFEERPAHPTSIYAVTKRTQEELVLTFGSAYSIPTVALRYFNVYGPRQALANPYTGVVAIFANRLLNRRPPLIFEDGGQLRDFVHVSDLVQAHVLAIDDQTLDTACFNVGTGEGTSIRHVADTLAQVLGVDIEPLLLEEYRVGDIRHCFADIARIRKSLSYQPSISIREGMESLLDWLQGQRPDDRVEEATSTLRRYGLTKGTSHVASD